MFKNFASDALGLSDIGKVISPADYNQTDSDDYILAEEGEHIYMLIKTKSDEYCFTNRAFIHVDGTSAMSKKRTMRRYEYLANDLTDVRLETAGTIDLDIEIEFIIGNNPIKIDIHKKYIKEITQLYKALVSIAQTMYKNGYKYETAERCLQIAANSVGRASGEEEISTAYQKILSISHDYYFEQQSKYYTEDFGFIYERYIR